MSKVSDLPLNDSSLNSETRDSWIKIPIISQGLYRFLLAPPGVGGGKLQSSA